MKRFIILTASLLLAASIVSCKKKDSDDPAPGPSYFIPSTYRGFSNADYSDVTIRLNMFKSIEAYLKKAIPTTISSSATAIPIDSVTLINMFANTNSPFSDSTSWNALSIQIEDQVNPIAKSEIEKILRLYAKSSASTQAADTGVAGLMATTISPKYILFDTSGVNHAQTFQKVMMGAFLVYQIDQTLANISTYDNTTLVSGKTYTAMEHAWDQSFGYLGFSGSYSADTLAKPAFIASHKSLYYYIANYSTQVDAGGGISTTKTLVNAFLKGRAAISNKDLTTRDAQVAIITNELERFLAASVIQETNEMLANQSAKWGDEASRLSLLSETKGFILAMKYNPIRKTISDAQINDLLAHLHNTLYNVASLDDVRYIKNTVSTIYGFDAVKDAL